MPLTEETKRKIIEPVSRIHTDLDSLNPFYKRNPQLQELEPDLFGDCVTPNLPRFIDHWSTAKNDWKEALEGNNED